MKYALLATTAIVLATAAASAQTVTRTDLASAGSLNIDTGLVSATSTTLSFLNDGATLLVIRNTGGSAVTATAQPAITEVNLPDVGRVSLTTVAVSIASNTRAVFGPFPTGRWNDAAGMANVTLSTLTNVSAGAIRAGR